jgi:hypothetical protein
MRLIFALAVFLAMTACQVTTSQSMGSGVTIRSSVPVGNDQASDEQAADEQDAEASQDRMQDLTIGVGFGTGVSN